MQPLLSHYLSKKWGRSNFSFKWTKPLYQDNLKYITVLYAFLNVTAWADLGMGGGGGGGLGGFDQPLNQNS